jgi:hypothetical protein
MTRYEKLALTYIVSGTFSAFSAVGDIGKFRNNIKEAIKSDPRPIVNYLQ